jgi:drug/metabolite transporter (DMT)-like permease
MYTSVSNGFILLYTAPCFVILLAPFILREPFEKKSLLALAVSFAGIVLIAGSNGEGLKEYNLWGNLLGLSSGILFAVYLVALKKLPSGLLGLVTNTYMSFTIALVALPLAAPAILSVTLPGLLQLAFMGILIQTVGTTIYMIGLRKVKAQHGSILCYFEALFAMLFAALFLQERMTPAFGAGTALIILGGGLIVACREKKSPGPGVSPTPGKS